MEKPLISLPVEQVRLLLEAGYIYIHMDRLDEAEQIFKGVIPLIPESEVPYVAIATLYYSQGLNTKALEAYTTALTLAPESPFAMVNFGDFLLFTEQREQGKAYLKKVIQSDTSGIYAKLAQDLLEAYHETL